VTVGIKFLVRTNIDSLPGAGPVESQLYPHRDVGALGIRLQPSAIATFGLPAGIACLERRVSCSFRNAARAQS